MWEWAMDGDDRGRMTGEDGPSAVCGPHGQMKGAIKIKTLGR